MIEMLICRRFAKEFCGCMQVDDYPTLLLYRTGDKETPVISQPSHNIRALMFS